MILNSANDPHVSVRRVAAMALYEITNRPEGQALLLTQTATFGALLVDQDIPIRRVTILAVDNLRLDACSPLLPVLETYLLREDAVSTIGAAVATVLMKTVRNNVGSTNAVVQFMNARTKPRAGTSCWTLFRYRVDSLITARLERRWLPTRMIQVKEVQRPCDRNSSTHGEEYHLGAAKDPLGVAARYQQGSECAHCRDKGLRLFRLRDPCQKCSVGRETCLE